MVAESPSLLLQRAANELERLTEHFAVYGEEQERSSEFPSAAARWVHLNVGTASHLPANEWMWTMTPAVAAPLAAWLRAIASNMAQAGIGEDWARAVFPPEARAALDFARLVLGVPSKEEEEG